MLSQLYSLGGKGKDLEAVKEMSRETLEEKNAGMDFFRFYEIALSEEIKQKLLVGYVLSKAHAQQEKERLMGMIIRLQNHIEETQTDHVQGGKPFQLHHLLWLESWQRMQSNIDKLSNEQVQQVIFYPLIQLACSQLLDETGKFNKDFLKMFFSDASPEELNALVSKQDNIVASFVRLLARDLHFEPSLYGSPFIVKEVHKMIQNWDFYQKEKLPEPEKILHWLQSLDTRIYIDSLLTVYVKQHQEQAERKSTKEEKGIFKFFERLTDMRDRGELQISPLVLANLIVQSDMPIPFKKLAQTVYKKLYSTELIRLDKENEAMLNAEGIKAKLGFAVQGAVSYQRLSSPRGSESPSSEYRAVFFRPCSRTSSTDSGDSLSNDSSLDSDSSPRPKE